MTSERYARISSLAELRSVRERVKWEIAYHEERLEEHWISCRNLFAVRTLVSSWAGKADEFRSLVCSAYKGYEFVRSMFVRKGAGIRKSQSVVSESGVGPAEPVSGADAGEELVRT